MVSNKCPIIGEQDRALFTSQEVSIAPQYNLLYIYYVIVIKTS